MPKALLLALAAALVTPAPATTIMDELLISIQNNYGTLVVADSTQFTGSAQNLVDVVEYAHGATSLTARAYSGGAYSPTLNSMDLETPFARIPPLSLSLSL